jgi:conjugative relaxase-like TrwC/TraI family protein
MTPRESAESAKAYYFEKARQDYYSEGQEIIGVWGGKGAERLGLRGRVEAQDFIALCDNVNPATGENLTPRTKAKRTCGYDFEFDLPKSVSVLYAWNGDERIPEVLLRAARESMAVAETMARTRVRINGQKDGDVPTRELLWAEFLHKTARPTPGHVPDPQLHLHCFTFNATFHDAEDRWKAAQFFLINQQAKHIEADFMTRVSNYLVEIGYPTRPAGKYFEVVGVPDDVIHQFSKRTHQIEEAKARLGITDPALAAKLGAWTRLPKDKAIPYTELREYWHAAVTGENRVAMDKFLKPPISRQLGRSGPRKVVEHPAEPAVLADPARDAATAERGAVTPEPQSPAQPELDIDDQPGRRRKAKGLPGAGSAMALLGPDATAPPKPKRPVDPSLERAALDRSILHNFHQASVVTDWDILTQAMRRSYGSGLTPEGLREAMKKHPELIIKEVDGRKLVTTHSVLAEERANVKWVKDGMGTQEPLVPGHRIRNEKLNEEQRAAVMHVLTSKDRVVAIEGKAGTGKTLLMQEAVAAMEAEGHKVLVVAPETPAVHETLRKRGFANAHTVQQLLVNEKLQDEYRHGVWWVDESGQISARSMRELFALADKHGARIVFSGDKAQHHAIERGDAMRTLYDYADLKPAMVTKILRQEGINRQIIELLSDEKVGEAFTLMNEAGQIHELPFPTRYKAVAQLYVKSSDDGSRPLVIAPTHAEGRLTTKEIRQTLKDRGELKDERPVSILREVHMSPADLADWHSYRPGWIIEYITATPGTQAGTRVPIEKIDYDEGIIYVKVPVDSPKFATKFARRALNLELYSDRFKVYRPDVEMLAAGDRIRITKNGDAVYGRSRVFNGAHYTLTGFDEHGDLKLDNGMVLDKDFAHLRYGYVTTSHGAQSKNVDHVIVVESAMSFGAANRRQIYVSESRGKKRMDTFTHNKQELLEAVSAAADRRSALELVEPKEKSPPPMPEDYQQELRAAQRQAEERIAKALEQIDAAKERKTKEQLGRHKTVPAPKPHKEARTRDMLGTRPAPKLSRPAPRKAPDVEREPPGRTIDIDI